MFGVSPLVPAYGRTYTSLEAAQADLDAGKDFTTASGHYIGRDELLKLDFVEIRCRYGRGLRRTGILQVRPAAAAAPAAPAAVDPDVERFASYVTGSALHAAGPRNERVHPCPTCREPDRLTARDVAAGYQCDACAFAAEGGFALD